jgi:diguanylate cyclase (GGDEF)-like protein
MGQLRKDILRRHGLASAGVLLFIALYYVGYGIEYGIAPSVWFYLITAVYLSGHIITVWFIYTERAVEGSDPSMTLPVMLLVILYMSGLMLLAPELRGIMILGYLNIMPFGVFRLTGRAFVGISLFTIVCYSLVIFSTHYSTSKLLVPEFEVVIGVALMTSLLVYAFIGREFFILRKAYGEKNSELRRALARIEELAVTDELTGLNNRRYLLKTLEKQRALSIRQGIPFVVAFIDIDYFKRVNDEHGHRIGDQVLAELAHLLRVSVREIDLAARYGGEEFVLLLSGLNLEAATGVLERIRVSVENHRFSELELEQRVSIGVAQYRPDEASEDVLNRADRMLYEAKRLGRNRITLESEGVV